MSYFKVKDKKKLSELNIGDRLEESDFAQLTDDGTFVQLEYIEEEDPVHKIDVRPGIFTIIKTARGPALVPSQFLKENVLKSFISTKEITDKIDCFFRNLHKYKDFDIEVPIRRMMFYGPPGIGKSTTLNEVSQRYNADGKTLVISWPTDKFESWEIKDFITNFNYNNVEKMILIVEDLGGLEMDQVRLKSDSALLSMLTNQDKTFNIPTLVVATTNHLEVFMGNLTNRPGRFDDKIKVGYPPASYRLDLLNFFAKAEVSKEAQDLILSKKCNEFSTAHIREVVIRSVIHEKTIEDTIKEIIKEIEAFKKEFSDKEGRMGISSEY